MQWKIFFGIVGLLVILAVYAGIKESGGVLSSQEQIDLVEDKDENTIPLLSGETGTLAGHISIGPICPVSRVPPDPNCKPSQETYAAYAIFVYNKETKEKISQLIPDSDGNFRLDLPSGIYLLNFAEDRFGPGGDNLPIEVLIRSQRVTETRIEIDTGIR